VAAEPQIGAEAMAHVAREAFDFIFIDMHLPEANRIAIARRILEQRRDARLLVLSRGRAWHRRDARLLVLSRGRAWHRRDACLLVLSRGRAWHRREIGRHPIAAA
jgi:CheY-like chemotaxis protein